MKISYTAVMVAAVVATSLTTSASAVISNTNPGYTGPSDIFEARIRVDGGNSQTWKTAFWQGGNLPQSTSGNAQNLWSDNVSQDFTITYNALTGATSMTVFNLGGSDRGLADNFALDAGNDFAGFRIYNRSNNDGSTGLTSNLLVSVDGAPAVAIADVASGGAQTFVESSVYWFDPAAETVEITGSVVFDWVPGSNLNNERFKTGVYFMQAIPTPGAAGLLAMAAPLALRRKR